MRCEKCKIAIKNDAEMFVCDGCGRTLCERDVKVVQLRHMTESFRRKMFVCKHGCDGEEERHGKTAAAD